MLLNGATITFLIGVISCIIGVLTFISGRISKAEQNGRFAEKLDTCAKGIAEIKSKLDSQESTQNRQDILLTEHAQQISHLETRIKNLEEREREESHEHK